MVSQKKNSLESSFFLIKLQRPKRSLPVEIFSFAPSALTSFSFAQEAPPSSLIEVARSKSILLETANISEVIPYVSENSLVIFDLDNTIVRSKNCLGSASWFYWMVQNEIKKGKTLDEARKHAFPNALQSKT